jgi:hypothetical protein
MWGTVRLHRGSMSTSAARATYTRVAKLLQRRTIVVAPLLQALPLIPDRD